MQNKDNPSFIPLLKDIIKSSKSKFYEAIFISLVTNLLAMAVPIFTMQIYDRVIVHKGITTLQGMVFIVVIVLIFDTVLRFGRARLFQRIGLHVDIELGRHLYQKISKLPLKTLEERDVSRWQTAFRDVETVRTTLSGPTMITALDLPFAILFLLVIFNLAPGLLIVFGFIIPFYIMLAYWSGRVISGLSQQEREQNLNRDMFMHEIIAGRGTVKSLALEDAFKPRYEATQAHSIRASIDRGSSADFHQVLTQSMQLTSLVTLTCVGAILILGQEMSMGTLIAVNMLSSRMISPIAGLVGQWRMVQSFRQAMERLSEIYALPAERPDVDLPLDRPEGTLKLETLSYSYQEQDTPNPIMAIDKLTGAIGAGGLHCLVGKNGSGKSTLLKLLAGLYSPLRGRILIDGADIGQFSRKDLAGWIGYLPQDCLLFAESIRKNIQIGGMPIEKVREGYSNQELDARMIEAAKLVGSHKSILDLPEGYDTELGEGGFGLSSGQRRRIALARAMMPNPSVLLMDEPTSDLDNEAEETLAQALKALSKDHTIIVATHSPLFLNYADSIMLLERGRVSAAGSAQDVLNRLTQQKSSPIVNSPTPSVAVKPETAEPTRAPQQAAPATPTPPPAPITPAQPVNASPAPQPANKLNPPTIEFGRKPVNVPPPPTPTQPSNQAANQAAQSRERALSALKPKPNS